MISAVVITGVTVAGSILSMCGAGFVLFCYAVLPIGQHFRHVLIFNLALSDFLNATNNSVAGLYILARGRGLAMGGGCTLNGFIGQVTVQATDCTILAIAIATVLAIVKRGASTTSIWQLNQVVLVYCATWALPFFTSLLALGMGWYAPATGNWCWIKAEPPYLRYALTHAWRMLFIIIEIALYIYLDVHLRRHYDTMSKSLPRDIGRNPRLSALSAIIHNTPNLRPSSRGSPIEAENSSPINQTDPSHPVHVFRRIPEPSSEVSHTASQSSSSASPSPSKQASFPSFGRITGLRRDENTSSANGTSRQYQDVQRVLLLNAYPLAYVILWIPGIVNRFIEASGHTSAVAQLFQASSQLVGLANALTYGWNEKVAMRLRERFCAQGQDSV